MSAFSRQLRSRIGRLLLVIFGLVVSPLPAVASDAGIQWIPLRNNNAFLQAYGLPPYQGGTLAADGEFVYSVSLDIANHADAGLTESESITIDGESYFLVLSTRYGAASWLELGMDLPLVSHSDGVFDNAIENWHDLWGLSNSKRRGPPNQLRYIFENPLVSNFELTTPSSGIGDVQLSAAIPIKRSNTASASTVALRSSIKIPTGEAHTLRGSGAFDFSLGLYVTDFATLGERELQFSGFAGVLLPGEGDLFPALQRRAVAFGGVGAKWQLTDKFCIAAQTYAQSSYLESDLDEIGGSAVQLALGGSYRFPERRVELALALVEDMFGDATTDVAFHFSVRVYSGN
ncbi:MAG: DUF3187 family protein [Gammaproteobacteria bacterium]|nr:DUF3187 family protein [Gammaproteobacteria bacterium]MDH5262004.1 DUF3187 family protein [Gammaproteobacteria bacterium]